MYDDDYDDRHWHYDDEILWRGKNYFFRLDTFYVVGEYVETEGSFWKLRNACWSDVMSKIPHALKASDFRGMSPYHRGGPVLINAKHVRDVCEVIGDLPYFPGRENLDE